MMLNYFFLKGLISAGREENGYREYNTHDIERLRQIKVLRALGVPIEDIRKYYRKQASMEELMRQRREQLLAQKADVQYLLELCETIEEQKLPLSDYTTRLYEEALERKTLSKSKHVVKGGQLLCSNVKNRLSRRRILLELCLSVILVTGIAALVIYQISTLISHTQYPLHGAQQGMIVFIVAAAAAILTVIFSIYANKNVYYELREEGLYYIDKNTKSSAWSYWKGITHNDYLSCMDFIAYEDIAAVKAGVQEAGMFVGGDGFFKFYLTVFSKDDRAIRLDSELFHGEKQFMTALRILHDKAPKWIDPKQLWRVLELPHEQAYQILNQFYWNRRKWHQESLYRWLTNRKKEKKQKH